MNALFRAGSWPLRVKLTVAFLVSMAILVIVVAFSIAQYNQGLQPVSNVLVKTLAEERAHQIDEMMTDISNNIRRFTSDPYIVSDTEGLTANNTATNTLRQNLQIALQAVLTSYPSITEIRLFSAAGDALVRVPVSNATNVAGDPYTLVCQCVNSLPQPAMRKITSTSGSDTLTFIDLVKGADVVGYVIVTVNPAGTGAPSSPSDDSLYSALKPVNYSGGTINYYLVNTDGTINSPLREPVHTSAALRGIGLDLYNNPQPDPHDFVSPLTGLRSVGFSVPISNSQWALTAETRLVQVPGNTEAGLFIIQLLTVMAIGLVLMGLVALLLDIALVRPVLRLRSAARVAAQGGTTMNTGIITQNDELGDLYQAFEALTGQFRGDIQALEISIEQRTRDIEATRDIGQALSSIRDTDQLLQQVVKLIEQRFEGVYHVQIYLIDSGSQYAILRAATGEVGAQLISLSHRLRVGSKNVIGQVTSNPQPLVVRELEQPTSEDTSTSALYRARAALPDTRSELALPLSVGGTIIGALDLHSQRVDAFSEADIRVFQNVADQLAIAVTNARLFEESQSRLSEIEDLNRRLLADTWRDYGLSRRRSVPAASTGNEPTDDWTALQRQAISSTDIVEQHRGDLVTFAVPVSLRGQVIGAVEWDIPESAYNENTRQLAAELASRLAISADNARLFEQSERAAQREHLVNEISSKLIQQTDVKQILQIAVKEVGQALHVPQTAIRLASSLDERE